MITPSGYRRGLVENREYVFTLMPPHYVTIIPFADYILNKRHKKVVLLSSQNSYYQEISDALVDYFEKQGRPLDRHLNFPPDEEDYKPTLLQLKSAGVDAVVIFLMEGGISKEFLAQARELNLDAAIYSGPSIPYDTVLAEQMELANGAIFFNYVIDPKKDFQKRYQERFEDEPGLGSMKAYDAIYVLRKICLSVSEE